MGFYLRKSLSVGPFRFNLSKSGLGVSTGIKGLRVGTGPRGNYVHMGRGGVYFRSALAPSSRRSEPKPHLTSQPGPQPVHLEEIESGDVRHMVDSSSHELLNEINSKTKAIRFWPIALALTGIAVVLSFICQLPWWANCGFLVSGLVVTGAAVYWDILRKSVVLFYDLEPHIEGAYQSLHDAFHTLRSCSRSWHVEAKGDLYSDYQRKINAGADALVRRSSITFQMKPPPYFKTNISIPAVPAGRQTLYFFPDRLLVFDSNGVGAVTYDKLIVESEQEKFIETSRVPSDSQVVGSTWRYANKSGGPDRRFKDNREIPIVLYGILYLRSGSGLNERFQLSRTNAVPPLQRAVFAMANAISNCQEGENTFMKCFCINCGSPIEFPSHGIGETIACPHCGKTTTLSMSSMPQRQST
jgi:hypothetical protein